MNREDVVLHRKKKGDVFSVDPPKAMLTVFVAGNRRLVAAV
jgi:hypothetical protein